MNQTEHKMLDILKALKEEHDIIAIKAEFEAEGSRTDELVMLNEIVFRADIKLCIKIGGCEAVRDLDQCRLLGASSIMAPMIESPFAMKKFVNAGKKVYADQWQDIEWIINAETITCKNNFEAILEEGKGFLNTVCIGRGDLSASMGISRDNINGEEVFEATKYMAEKAREYGYTVNFGGGMTLEAIPFVQRMYPLNDRFETRKVIFKATDKEDVLRTRIMKAMEFETLYLKNKCEYYDRISKEDQARIKMFAEKLEIAGSDISL